MPKTPPLKSAARKNQSGAFDLPSVLIGVSVVAILAIGVMAAVFGVIPWAQDRAAKQDLAALGTAQGAAYARDGSFAGKTSLVGGGWLGQDTPGALQATAGADGKCYVAVTTAQTGNKFIASSANPAPRPLEAGDTWCSGTLISDPEPVMVSTWDTGLAESCKEITLPVTGFKGTVDWGDGTRDAATRHTFKTTGKVDIRIDGTFTSWGGSGWADAACLTAVDRWGATGTASLESAFADADHLERVLSIPSTVTNMAQAFSGAESDFTLGMLDTANVTNMSSMFSGAAKFNSPVEFDTSKVTGMSGMFKDATVFNQPVFFDTSRVTNMGAMFMSTKAFNQPVLFDTSKVTNMASMFDLTDSFNQPLDFDTSSAVNTAAMFSNARAFNQPVNFDTSKVTNMYAMFQHTISLNQPVRLNTSSVTDMRTMFSGALIFNQPLDFDTSQVTTMVGMFYGAGKFNQPVNFDTSRVTLMTSMFKNAASFNQPVPFNTSAVTSMDSMFYGASAFNKPVGFDTSAVTVMSSMFHLAASFNQPLKFDTSKVTSMNSMFYGAAAFNQDLSAWDVRQVASHEVFNSGTVWRLPMPAWIR